MYSYIRDKMRRSDLQFTDMRLLLLFLAPLAAEGSILGAIHKVLAYYGHQDELSDNFIFGILLTQVKRFEDSLKLLRKPDLKLNSPKRPSYVLETNLIHGSPGITNATHCLLEAMVRTQISNFCLIQMADIEARGYTLSHQAIFYSIASSLLTFPIVEELIKQRCQKMLSEVNYAWDNDMPYTLQDLIVEEVGVCGMNNYQEFLTEPMLNFILSLQRQEGCFAVFRDGQLDKCHEHLSAVSMFALSMFLYKQNENQNITQDYYLLDEMN
ncbi:uncharacterized protein [Halyomorpha halys]|uniref:uncharacterized protein isoform X2 n=1 Tax=Halyomorpha halys TaxID=286706 RepID=UPI0006D5236F|nr:uncharacterized protein LOC106686593 isoform X2 [Halyomorpha halys]